MSIADKHTHAHLGRLLYNVASIGLNMRINVHRSLILTCAFSNICWCRVAHNWHWSRKTVLAAINWNPFACLWLSLATICDWWAIAVVQRRLWTIDNRLCRLCLYLPAIDTRAKTNPKTITSSARCTPAPGAPRNLFTCGTKASRYRFISVQLVLFVSAK